MRVGLGGVVEMEGWRDCSLLVLGLLSLPIMERDGYCTTGNIPQPSVGIQNELACAEGCFFNNIYIFFCFTLTFIMRSYFHFPSFFFFMFFYLFIF